VRSVASCWAIGRSSVDATKARLIFAVRAVLAALLARLPRLTGLWRRTVAFFVVVVRCLAVFVLLDCFPDPFFNLLDLLFAVLDPVFVPLDSVRGSLFVLLDVVFFLLEVEWPEVAFESPAVCPETGNRTIRTTSRPARHRAAVREKTPKIDTAPISSL
jgi:hypothetical protein